MTLDTCCMHWLYILLSDNHNKSRVQLVLPALLNVCTSTRPSAYAVHAWPIRQNIEELLEWIFL